MENSELHKIEKDIKEMEFNMDPISNLMNELDNIYIILDEERHINVFNERLCSIKSNLSKGIELADLNKKQEIFEDAKKEVLLLLEEISEVA